MSIITAAICLYLLSILLIHIRCSRTFPLTRQLSDFSTFTVPFNVPAYALSKVPLQPIVPQRFFPELSVLSDNWETIRDEALALYQMGHIKAKDDLPASSFYKNGRWVSFYLKVYDSDIPSARELAPKTLALIEQVPNMNLALFAVLMPGKKLNDHHDPFAFTLRYSLGLSTPNSDECGIQIDQEDYKWKDGESVLFDETYLHNAYNDTDTPRLILMTDIDRPLKWAWLQKLYHHFGRFFNSLFVIDNVDENQTGLGNKLGQGVLAYQTFLKGLKRKNRTAYQIGKWAVILLVLYGLARLVS
ncbi:MAG TPA: aspartyl/asparaginyl beta-hydroxylase domain-containing protein [Alcanivoracaceae bacterium]|nr:aspartyl/asparaginyl beta-hydroxylase domain-containing protein [Alcanivoracaceae bacterium]